jgi:diaminopimelate epimerase
MPAMRFAKYEGLGNDFVLVDGIDVSGAQAVALCDRHRGVGADGVIVVGVRDGRPAMRVINADGSLPEMCGNGLRCVALHLVRSRAVPRGELDVETDAGPHRCRVLDDDLVEVRMAVPSLDPGSVPVRAEGPLVDAPFEVGGETLRVTTVSMGNPHVVTFDDVGDRRLVLGPCIETDPRFPSRTNVGFARPSIGGGLELTVWERGAGWTRACWTVACAAAVAAVETGRLPRGEPLRVHLPGGTLTVRVDAPGSPVWMTGPARHVFDGQLDLEAPGWP